MVWNLVDSGVLISPGFTTQTLVNGIRDAFNSGFGITPFDEFANNVVFGITHSTGTSYVRYTATGTISIQVAAAIASGWDAVAHTGTNQSTLLSSASLTASNSSINYNAYDGPEGKLLVCPNSAGWNYLLGWLIPQTVPPGWAGLPTIFGLHPGSQAFGVMFNSNGLQVPTNVPYGGATREFKSTTMPVYKSANLAGERAVNTPFYFSIDDSSAAGAPGPVFQDLASVAGNGLNPNDVVAVGTDRWLKIEPSGTMIAADVFMRIA